MTFREQVGERRRIVPGHPTYGTAWLRAISGAVFIQPAGVGNPLGCIKTSIEGLAARFRNCMFARHGFDDLPGASGRDSPDEAGRPGVRFG